MVKPVELWFFLGSVAVAVILYLLPKTPSIVIGCLAAIFILLLHPIWNFWWIEQSIWLRLFSILLFASLLCLLGYFVYPKERVDKIIPNVKQPSSKLLVSIHPIYSKDGSLILKMTFSNDSDKQCIIEFVHIMTLNHDALRELNKTADISLDNNYNNMFEGKGRMSLVPYPFLKPKPNLPKVLTPHELWPYETREPFDPLIWMKAHELENIKRIPIGLSIQFIDFTGASKMTSLAFFSELSISEDGKIHGNRGVYQRTELSLD